MTFYERSELFRKYPKTPVFDHSNYRLFERIRAVPGTSNNRGLTVIACAATILYHSPAWLVSGMSKTAIKSSNFENRLRCHHVDG